MRLGIWAGLSVFLSLASTLPATAAQYVVTDQFSTGGVSIWQEHRQPVDFILQYKCDYPEITSFALNNQPLCTGDPLEDYAYLAVKLTATADVVTYNGRPATPEYLGGSFIALGSAQKGGLTWLGLIRFICTTVGANQICNTNYGWEFGLYDDTWNYSEIGGVITSIEVVPLPAAAWLFLAGLSGLGLYRRSVGNLTCLS